MASRRTRIKGLANIPQRRKNCSEDTQVKSQNVGKLLTEDPATIEQDIKISIEQKESESNVNIHVDVSELVGDIPSKISSSSIIDQNNPVQNFSQTDNPGKKLQNVFQRRKFMKPTVSLTTALMRKSNNNEVNGMIKEELTNNHKPEIVSHINDENTLSTISSLAGSKKTLNEVTLMPQNDESTNVDTEDPAPIEQGITVSVEKKESKDASSSIIDQNNLVQKCSQTDNPETKLQNVLQRRKFIKPTISLSNALLRKSNNSKINGMIKEEHSNNVDEKDHKTQIVSNNKDENTRSTISSLAGSEMTFNEVTLIPQNDESTNIDTEDPVPIEQDIKISVGKKEFKDRSSSIIDQNNPVQKFLQNDNPETKLQNVLQRRKFIKPTVSLSNALLRKSNNSEIIGMIKEEHSSNVDEKDHKTQIVSNKMDENTTSTISSLAGSEMNLNEVTLRPQHDEITNIDKEDPVPIEQDIKISVGKKEFKDPSSSIFDQNNPVQKFSETDNPETKVQNVLQRRKFIKPTVSLSNALQRKSNNSEIIGMIKEEHSSNVDEKDHKTQIMSNKMVENTPSTISSLAGSEMTLNEVTLMPQHDESSNIDKDKFSKKHVNVSNTNPLSDSEYPAPPPSPSKINRARIKAIPRLGYRKASFSASESEDESRRNSNRNRNDSVCSTASIVTETIADGMSPQRPKETTMVCQRTGHKRRKKYYLETDRQKLTMMDLIYYNPSTNPMKTKSKIIDDVAEEAADDPTGEEPTDKEKEPDKEEEDEMPVPQIKVSATGEIILDEQSLVVERKDVKKQRAEIQRSKLVDGDFDTSYGIYKKHKRVKSWSSSETMRFYRALNTLGTDFSLICDLFPNRTRRDLKKKFNKEEKINRVLIDKALMQPCQYAFEELKLDLERELMVQEERRKQVLEDMKLRQERLEENRKRKAKKMENIRNDVEQLPPPKIRKVRKPRIKKYQSKLSIESVLDDTDADVSDVDTQSASDDELKPSRNSTKSDRVPKLTETSSDIELKSQSKSTKPARVAKLTPKFVESMLDDSDADMSDLETQSVSEDELILSHKPTRSGRVPKVTQKFEPDVATMATMMKRNKAPQPSQRKNEMEPGSIMVVNEKGPNDEPIYKIFMVTSEGSSKTPLDLASHGLSNVMQFKKGLKAENILTISATITDDEEEVVDDPPPVENNMTIVEDTNVTTLKTMIQLPLKEERNISNNHVKGTSIASKTSHKCVTVISDEIIIPGIEGNFKEEKVEPMDLSKRIASSKDDIVPGIQNNCNERTVEPMDLSKPIASSKDDIVPGIQNISKEKNVEPMDVCERIAASKDDLAASDLTEYVTAGNSIALVTSQINQAKNVVPADVCESTSSSYDVQMMLPLTTTQMYHAEKYPENICPDTND